MFNFKQELQSTITLFQKHLFITVFFIELETIFDYQNWQSKT